MNPSKPEPAPRNRGAPIVPMVIEDLQIRMGYGRVKYGDVLRAENGRNALVDLYQELLDAAIYCRQLLAQQAATERTTHESYIVAEAEQPASRPVVVPGVGGGTSYRSEDIAPGKKPAAKRETVLEEAQRLVYGPREATYSHPARDFAKTAKIWTGILLEKLRPNVEITAHEATLCMVGVKLSRESFQRQRDNRVDGPGYWACADRIIEAEEQGLTFEDLIREAEEQHVSVPIAVSASAEREEHTDG